MNTHENLHADIMTVYLKRHKKKEKYLNNGEISTLEKKKKEKKKEKKNLLRMKNIDDILKQDKRICSH